MTITPVLSKLKKINTGKIEKSETRMVANYLYLQGYGILFISFSVFACVSKLTVMKMRHFHS